MFIVQFQPGTALSPLPLLHFKSISIFSPLLPRHLQFITHYYSLNLNLVTCFLPPSAETHYLPFLLFIYQPHLPYFSWSGGWGSSPGLHLLPLYSFSDSSVCNQPPSSLLLIHSYLSPIFFPPSFSLFLQYNSRSQSSLLSSVLTAILSFFSPFFLSASQN